MASGKSQEGARKPLREIHYVQTSGKHHIHAEFKDKMSLKVGCGANANLLLGNKCFNVGFGLDWGESFDIMKAN